MRVREMDELLFAENIGRSILLYQFKYYKTNTLDDVELIPIIKAVINGISNNLLSLNNKKSDIKK